MEADPLSSKKADAPPPTLKEADPQASQAAAAPPPPTAAGRLPAMVLVDRSVRIKIQDSGPHLSRGEAIARWAASRRRAEFINMVRGASHGQAELEELEEFMEIMRGALPRGAALDELEFMAASRRRAALEEPEFMAASRRRAALEEPGFMAASRRQSIARRAASVKQPEYMVPFPCRVRKEWPEWLGFLVDRDTEAAYFLGVLEGTEPCSPQVADPRDGVTSLSLDIAWPPNRCRSSHPDSAIIVGCHKNLLLLCLGNQYGFCHGKQDGVYMVYNTKANSIAIVPRRICSSSTHFPIARVRWEFQGVAVLRLSTSEEHDDYLLAELLFRTQDRSGHYPTKATLFLWRSRSASVPLARWPICSPYICLTPDKVPPFPENLAEHALQWIPKEVELPFLPTDKDHHPTFRADMSFAAGATSLCWVDLLEGILVYNHNNLLKQQQQPFHFIPLPPEAYAVETISNPQEYRSMCCIKGGALKFVSMEGYNRQDISMADVVLITWILTNPQSRTKWEWRLFESVRIGDLLHDPHYNEVPLVARFPFISTVEPHVIYLTVHNYEYNPKYERMESTEPYVLGVDMHLRGVVSAFKASTYRMLASHFTRYLNQRTICPMEKVVADEGDPAAWASVWISTKPLGVSPTEPAHKAGRHGGFASSGGFAKFMSKTGLTMSSISSEVGLQCVLGH